MTFVLDFACGVVGFLNWFGKWLPQLALRVLLAWEFWESGVQKYRGTNWFAEIQDKFPAPFDQIPVEVSWKLAMWTELVAPVMLVLGLGTRFAAASLLVLDVVAWWSVHAGNGYNVCDNGWKMALIYLVLLLPLLFSGPGRLSIDHMICRRYCGHCAQ